MIVKMLRKRYSSLTYMKKFLCPVCKQYTLHLIHDLATECENECAVMKNLIPNIVNGNDFISYYTAEEIEEKFYDINVPALESYNDTLIFEQLNLFINKEKTSIINLLHLMNKNDAQLDNIVVHYFNDQHIKEASNVTGFGYLVNVAEEINWFIDICLKDLILFNYGIAYADLHFYSGRFFYNNAVEHAFLAYERIYVALGIIFGYPFIDDLTQNKTLNIEKYLKKCTGFKASDFAEINNKLKGDALFKLIKDYRNSNTHDISEYINKIIKDAREGKNLEYWNRDGNEVDVDEYLPRIKEILFFIEKLSNIFSVLLTTLLNKSLYSLASIPMIGEFKKIDDIDLEGRYDPDKLNSYITPLAYKIHSNPASINVLIKDLYMRSEEAAHCLADTINIDNGLFFDRWIKLGLYLEGLIDSRYLVYSALLRVYSSFDKLSRYLAVAYKECNTIKYFSDISLVMSSEAVIIRSKKFQSSESYQRLSKFRNMLYHNLRPGQLYGESLLTHHDTIMWCTIYDCIINLVEIVNLIYPKANNKIARNDTCPCGSGKKYKKCCYMKSPSPTFQ